MNMGYEQESVYLKFGDLEIRSKRNERNERAGGLDVETLMGGKPVNTFRKIVVEIEGGRITTLVLEREGKTPTYIYFGIKEIHA